MDEEEYKEYLDQVFDLGKYPEDHGWLEEIVEKERVHDSDGRTIPGCYITLPKQSL